jgi:hypothetical protein
VSWHRSWSFRAAEGNVAGRFRGPETANSPGTHPRLCGAVEIPGLAIGVVSASVSGGTWAMADILITHDGRLAVRPGMYMRD